MPCNTDLDLRVMYQKVGCRGVIEHTLLWREPKSIPTTDMGGYQQGRWERVKERSGQGQSTVQQPRFNFYLGFDQLVIIDGRSFASLPRPSTRVLTQMFDHTGEK